MSCFVQSSLECHLFFGLFLKHICSTTKHQFFFARSVKVGVFARGCKQMAKKTGAIESCSHGLGTNLGGHLTSFYFILQRSKLGLTISKHFCTCSTTTSKSQISLALHTSNWSNGGLQRRSSSTKPLLLDLAHSSPSLMTSRLFALVRFHSPGPLAYIQQHLSVFFFCCNISIYKNKCRHNLHIPKSNHEGLWYLEVIKIESNKLHKMSDDSLDRLGIKRVWPASRLKLRCRLQRGVWGSI